MSIRESLTAWLQQNGQVENLRTARPNIPSELDDRQADICEPLLAIADIAGGDWPERSRNALVTLCAAQADDDNSLGVKLLSASREAFHATNADRLATQQLLEQLMTQVSAAPWAGWWEHDVRNGTMRGPAAKLARLLKPYGIHARVIRLPDGTTPRGYLREDFKEAWKRSCPSKLS